jgi:fumarylacetoacetase
MNYTINETHDPNLESWVESANLPGADFPIQNLPFVIYWSDSDLGGIGVIIGDHVFDVSMCAELGFLDDMLSEQAEEGLFDGIDLSDLQDWSPQELSAVRLQLSRILRSDVTSYTKAQLAQCLTPLSKVTIDMPYPIGDYTDFYCSIFHATNVGSMFRPDNPLLPNYKYVPIGYHGRASSIVPSGTPIKRPKGQNRSDAEKPPIYIPCRNLDYEMEVGFFVGKGNDLGETIPIEKAEQHIFGLCLVNDWSARDVQAWEYQPLGPFLAKNFATTISPFIVTMEALAPFRTPAFERPDGDPAPLGYLAYERNEQQGGFDINLEVYIASQKMRDEGIEPMLVSRSNMKDLYWTIGQMLTHHASNGCNLQIGDLIATGTVSGPEKSERGCLLEMTWRGTEPIELPTGEQRRFLEDGDEVIMRGYCEREGFRRIGFGECRGIIMPAD